MMKVMEGFHHLISKIIVGDMTQCVRAEGWEWPHVEDSLESAGLWPMQEYTMRLHSTIEYYITTIPSY